MTLMAMNQLKKINELQENLIALCDIRHELLINNNMDEAETINRKEMLLLFDLEKEMKDLKKEIESNCEKNGLAGRQMKDWLPYLPIEQREEVLAYQRCAFTYEKILKNKLKSNESLVLSKMILPEVLRNSYVQISQDAGMSGKSLLNRKY